MSSRRLIAMLPLLMIACSSGGSGAPSGASSGKPSAQSKEDAALAAAKSAAGKLGTETRTKLVDALNNGGPANAVTVCSAEAQAIAERVAKETGASVGRSSLKLRNVKDAPPGWVQTWLVAQGDKKADQTQGIEGVFDSPVGRVARFLKPIGIDGTCLSCHGDPDSISEPVKTVLASKYPEDKATGYKAGDLRGALWAEVPVGR
ncbi:MAG: DUF3365 domain-containing protein [Polyangiaceae bacterium]|nr:DUF3365 domain-containing protein [Polyangiaceae bacterium]